MYIQDSLKLRPHNPIYVTDYEALKYYMLIKSLLWKRLMRTVALIQLGLVIYERPNYFGRILTIPRVAISIELVCLFVYCLHLRFEWLSYGRNLTVLLRNRATCFIILMIPIYSMFLLIRMAEPSFPNVIRVFRPFFLIWLTPNLRRITDCMVRSMGVLLNMMLLILVHVLLFSCLGYILFHDIEVDGAYFEDIGNCFLHLFVLLTTSNFPDVMMPAYRGTKFAPIFFVSYLVIGLYFLMNLALAAVYSAYKSTSQRDLGKEVSNSADAISAAYTLLDDMSEGRGISHDCFVACLAHYRPSVSPRIYSSLYTAVNVVEHQYIPKDQGKCSSSNDEKNDADGKPDMDTRVHDHKKTTGANTFTPSNGSKKVSSSSPLPTPGSQTDANLIPLISTLERADGKKNSDSSGSSRDDANVGRHDDNHTHTHSTKQQSQLFDPAFLYNDHDETSHDMEMLGIGVELENNNSVTGTTRKRTTIVHSTLPAGSMPQAHILTMQPASVRVPSRGNASTSTTSSQVSSPTPLLKTGLSLDEFSLALRFVDARFQVSDVKTEEEKEQILYKCGMFLVHNEWLLDVAVVLNSLLVVLHVHLTDDHGQWINAVQSLFALLFAFELVLRVAAFKKDLFSNYFSTLDFFFALICILGELYTLLFLGGTYNIAGYFRCIRIVRILFNSDHFRPILKGFFEIVKVMYNLFGIVSLIFYPFAILGMALFAGKVTPETVSHTCDYHILNYYLNNFDNVFHAYVTQFELLVVNNWQVIMYGHISATGHWAAIFFMTFYVVNVLLVMNVVTVFILEAFFVQQRGRNLENLDECIMELTNDRITRLCRDDYHLSVAIQTRKGMKAMMRELFFNAAMHDTPSTSATSSLLVQAHRSKKRMEEERKETGVRQQAQQRVFARMSECNSPTSTVNMEGEGANGSSHESGNGFGEKYQSAIFNLARFPILAFQSLRSDHSQCDVDGDDRKSSIKCSNQHDKYENNENNENDSDEHSERINNDVSDRGGGGGYQPPSRLNDVQSHTQTQLQSSADTDTLAPESKCQQTQTQSTISVSSSAPTPAISTTSAPSVSVSASTSLSPELPPYLTRESTLESANPSERLMFFMLEDEIRHSAM